MLATSIPVDAGSSVAYHIALDLIALLQSQRLGDCCGKVKGGQLPDLATLMASSIMCSITYVLRTSRKIPICSQRRGASVPIPCYTNDVVAKGAKLLAAIQANPRNVRFDDACRAARLLGFTHEGGKGSHRVFKRKGEPAQLNFQNRDGYVPPYQARQLVRMIEKYGSTL
jgi:hypothetical protein